MPVCPGLPGAAVQARLASRHPGRFSERRLEPMTLVVTPPRAGYGVPRTPEALSPELVLVDPELAASARAMLPEPRSALREVGHPLPLTTTTVPRGRSGRSRMRRSRSTTDMACRPLQALMARPRRRGRGHGPEPLALRCAGAGRPDTRLCRNSGRATSCRFAARSLTIGVRAEACAERRTLVKPKARRFAWAPTPGATGYHVELFRRDVRIFAADTKEPQLAIPARWKLNGRRRELSAGEYRWFVWPVVSGLRASSATVQATVTIPR